MNAFHQILGELRKARRVSQRAVAAELYISQALLSHYENGIREPGLDFVNRACNYYGVTADYLLGRTDGEEESEQVQVLTTLSDASGEARAISAQLMERLVFLEEQIARQMRKETSSL